MEKEVRVRFAPSPTGALHIGGIRTALYNYLFARKHNGKMILRIEDTDQNRYVPGAEEYILEALKWAGIEYDEGPVIGGPYGPYRQSERKDIYAKYAQYLLDHGHAYYAFDTPEELDAMRERLKESRVASLQYNSITRMQMKNSITLSDDEVKERLASGEPYVIRLKVPRKEEVRLHDLVRGWVMVHSSAIDDKVLMKSDGMPTYHLANVVDDHLMKITHVIRGEEWLPSAPLHVLLYRFLGWEDTMPQFAHLPLLLKPDGNGKLSKRDGDKHGFPVFPISGSFPDKDGNAEIYHGFREAGYIPQAFINFLAFLGWNPGTEQEIFSIKELIDNFSIERINKSGAKFDIDKARWFNQQYLNNMSAADLAVYLKHDLDANGIAYGEIDLGKVCEILKGRITYPSDLWKESKFLFTTPHEWDEQVVQKKWNPLAVEFLTGLRERILALDSLTAESAKETLDNLLEEKGVKLGQVMQALRLAVTGSGTGPDLMKILEILGKEETALRLNNAIEKLPVAAG
ncbi:glutamate--tRNA ligase [Fulvivirga sedimenti]|uniref:Glutamate--tRNA ligase n=1 Tax=Fulvivirga sedimenti TaxID=2879465 RepID=A0A9X1KZ80_9BACT|nr:glutamate--tRNA ligase [Fulvivirga sedimenti]MCA6074401.1 glutamate--tRNA ligase [Fulvivirga sedimenti]